MSSRAAILSQLVRSKNTAVERVVELAIGQASPEEQRELADVLMQRNRRTGWGTLIRVFDRLQEDVRELVLSRPRDLFGPLAETMNDPEGPARENVIQIVRRCADGRLVYLLAEALIDARAGVRELAAGSLLEAVRKHRQRSDAWEPANDNLATLQRAIQFALRQYRTHRQPAVLTAALILERQQDAAVWAYFQDPCDEATRAATALLRGAAEADVVGGLLLALASPLRPAAMAGIAAIESGPAGDALARESFRLLDPALQTSAQGVGQMRVLAGHAGSVPWTLETWPGWLRLIERTGLQGSQKLHLLQQMLESIPTGAVVWKMTVLKGLSELGAMEAGRLIAPLTGDANESVARFAARCLLGRSRSEWRNLAAVVLPRSPHFSVRKLGVGLRAPVTEVPFDRMWGDYARMPPAIQHSTTRTGVNKPDFVENLRLKLASDQPMELAQGLKMLSAVPDLVPYRGQIIALCGHADARITAIAVRLLGRLEDPRLKELLEAAARHEDARVRANAVESMTTLHIADRSQQVLGMLNSRHNRERANAIKAISQFDYFTARDCLERMLADPNPMHRISALWVVEQLRMLDVIRRVSSIARRDPNLRVRRRATEMLETLTTNVSAAV